MTLVPDHTRLLRRDHSKKPADQETQVWTRSLLRLRSIQGNPVDFES